MLPSVKWESWFLLHRFIRKMKWNCKCKTAGRVPGKLSVTVHGDSLHRFPFFTKNEHWGLISSIQITLSKETRPITKKTNQIKQMRPSKGHFRFYLIYLIYVCVYIDTSIYLYLYIYIHKYAIIYIYIDFCYSYLSQIGLLILKSSP